jgi:hypothetical protein
MYTSESVATCGEELTATSFTISTLKMEVSSPPKCQYTSSGVKDIVSRKIEGNHR